MEGVTGETNGSLVENKAGKETENGQPNKEVIVGEILWVKLHEASWWPAQVVDENSISSPTKPSSKGLSSDVLVRLYGSYIYKYVDVNRSRAEFKNILIENNFNHDDILKKSLEQDLPSLNSSKSRRRQQSKSKGTVVTPNGSSEKDVSDKSQVKKRKQEKPKTAESPNIKKPENNPDPSTPNSARQELSGRRMKVMQSLGLVAPSGSPFPRNRVVSPNPAMSN